MKKLTRLIILCSCLLNFHLLYAQYEPGFERKYPIAAGYTLNGIEKIDDHYLLHCNNDQEIKILTTDLNGEFISFEAPPQPPCPLTFPDSGFVKHHRLDFEDVLLLFQTAEDTLTLKRYKSEACAISELLFSQKYVFSSGAPITATALQAHPSENSGFYIVGHQYLGETIGADPGIHTFKIWIIKTNREGKEIWRYESNEPIYSQTPEGEVSIHQLWENGTCMVMFQNPDNAYPILTTTDKDGTELFAGRLSNSLSDYYGIGSGHLIDGSLLEGIYHPFGNGHGYYEVVKKPAVGLNRQGSSVGYTLDAQGPFTPSRELGLIHTEYGAWIEGIQLVKNDSLGKEIWRREYPNLVVSVSQLYEIEEEEAILVGGRKGGVPWLMKVYNPDFKVDSVYIPESYGPIVPGRPVGILYNFGFDPAAWGIIDVETRLGFYYSSDDQWDSSDSLLLHLDFTLVPPNANYFSSLTLPDFVGPGDHYIILVMDDLQTSVEPDEENNIFAMPFRIHSALVESEGEEVVTVLEIDLCEGAFGHGEPLYADTTFIDTIPRQSQSILNDTVYQINYDSILISNFHVFPNSTTPLFEAICEGATYDFHGQILTEAGTYAQDLTSIHGCDSTLILTLEIDPNFENTVILELEAGMEYNGQIINSDTLLVDSLMAQNGCDSIVRIFILVLTSTTDVYFSELSMSIVPNPFSQFFELQFSLEEDAEIDFDLFDFSGKQIDLNIAPAIYASGAHQLEVDLSDQASGLYLIRLKTKQFYVEQKLVKIH